MIVGYRRPDLGQPKNSNQGTSNQPGSSSTGDTSINKFFTAPKSSNGDRIANINYWINSLTPQELLTRYQTFHNDPTAWQRETSQYGTNIGNSQIYKDAYDSMWDIFKRAPTLDEWNQLLPTYSGPDGLTNGRRATTIYNQQIEADPTNPNSSSNPNNPRYGERIAPYSQSVNDQFKSIYGRDPTAQELQHYAGLLASGQTDAYGLQNYLKQLPEFTNAEDARFRQGLNSELENYNTAQFNRQKGDIMADYARRGFAAGTSPSLDYALTDLMGKLAENRSSYLANLSAQQYGSNKDLAASNYQNSLNQMYENSIYKRNRLDQQADYSQLRGDQATDYARERADMNDWMAKNQGRSNNPLYGAAGGLIGGGVGMLASGGNPMWGYLGYQTGSTIGNNFA